jgi:hypothetical protein
MVKTLLHRVKDVQHRTDRALSRGIIVGVVVVLHGDLWCNHAYACAQYHAARFLPVPSRHSAPTPFAAQHKSVSHWPSADSNFTAHSLQALFVLLARGPLTSCSPVSLSIMVRLCHLSNFRLPSASTSHLTAYSAQRASLSVLVSTCPFLYFCVSAHYREEGLV